MGSFLYWLVSLVDMALGWLVDDAFSDLAEEKAKVKAAESGRDRDHARLTTTAEAARARAVETPVAVVPVPTTDEEGDALAAKIGRQLQ